MTSWPAWALEGYQRLGQQAGNAGRLLSRRPCLPGPEHTPPERLLNHGQVTHGSGGGHTPPEWLHRFARGPYGSSVPRSIGPS